MTDDAIKKATAASYQERRRAAIAALEKAFGKDAVVSHEVAALVLPNVPEWEQYRLPRRNRKGTSP